MRPEDIFRMREMYLSGSSYGEISMSFNQKKALVVFISERERWYAEKIEKAEMTAESLSQNYNYIKADSALFFTEIVDCLQKYYREQIKNYNKSKDPSIVEKMDFKPLQNLLKAREMLDKLMTKDSGNVPPNPLVNINMGSGSVTESNGTMTLTPGNAEKLDSSKVFELLAELKKQQDLEGK